jgi:hypothetical protein
MMDAGQQMGDTGGGILPALAKKYIEGFSSSSGSSITSDPEAKDVGIREKDDDEGRTKTRTILVTGRAVASYIFCNSAPSWITDDTPRSLSPSLLPFALQQRQHSSSSYLAFYFLGGINRMESDSSSCETRCFRRFS